MSAVSVERAEGAADVLEVLERALDKGIRTDASARLSPRGISLLSAEARLVVTPLEPETAPEARAA